MKMDAQTFELKFKLNGKEVNALVDTRETLLDVIRDTFGLTGAKKGCDEAACGACSVLFNGHAVCSCTMLAAEAHGGSIVTVEGLSVNGEPASLQKAFMESDALQCGFCTSGQIIAAASLLDNADRELDDNEIREGMSGNVCRCGAYNKILHAVSETSRKRKAK